MGIVTCWRTSSITSPHPSNPSHQELAARLQVPPGSGAGSACSWMFFKAIETVSISIATQTFGISYIYRNLMSKWYFSSKFWLIYQEFMHVPHVIYNSMLKLIFCNGHLISKLWSGLLFDLYLVSERQLKVNL